MKGPQFGARLLRTRLILLVVIIVLPGILFVVAGDLRERDAKIAELQDTNADLTAELGAAVAAEINAMKQLLAGLAQDDDYNTGSWGACNARMAAVLAQFPQYANLGFATNDGVVRCSALPLADNVTVNDRAWFQRARATARFAIGEFQTGRVTNRSSINGAFPVNVPTQGIVGVTFAALDLAALHERLAEHQPDGAVLLVLDRHRVVLVREPDHGQWVGRAVDDYELLRQVGTASSGEAHVKGLDGVDRYYNFIRATNDDEGSLLVTRGVSERPIITATNQDMMRSIGAFTLVGLVAAAAAWWVGARLVLKHEEATARLAAIVSNSDDAIIGETLDGTITSWNPAAERLYGYSSSQAIGRNVSMLVPPESGDREREHLLDVAAGRNVTHFDTVRRRRDGSLVDVSVSISGIRDSTERIVAAAEISRDISTQKAAQRELEKARQIAEETARSKSEFLANMSHEIRTPLNAVIGMTGLLLETKLSSEQREFAETIRASGDHLLTVINDILDISKIEAGAMRVQPRPVSVRQVVEEAFDLVAERAAQKGLELIYEIDPDVPAGIETDPTRLRQVLVNLLGNAVKFTQRGEVALHIQIEPQEQPPHALHFAVRDTGMGIPAEKLDRLFKPFSQVDSSTSRAQGGTGLGLAISRRLVELMDGRIWAESIQGRGSTFHFTIRAPVAEVPSDVPEGTVPDLREKSALIVDDNATNRRILALQAQSWGMRTREAATPLQALQVLAGREPFDVILLDYSMPQMDGIALARRIRALDHRANTPLVVLTSLGHRVEDDLTSLRLADYLTKPVRKSQLYNALVGTLKTEPEPQSAPDEGATPAVHLKILLAEDNAVNQKVAVKLLERMGYRPVVVSNGEQAVRAVEADSFDAVLMDIQMPEVDGLEATRRIRAMRPRESGPYIIAMTAHAMEGDREAALEAGMDEYLTKPIDTERLRAALERVPFRRGKVHPSNLQRLREELGEEAARQIVDAFIEETPKLVGSLRAAADAGDRKALDRAAHTLKSTAATLGAEALRALAEQLEREAPRGDLAVLSSKVRAVEIEAKAFVERVAKE